MKNRFFAISCSMALVVALLSGCSSGSGSSSSSSAQTDTIAASSTETAEETAHTAASMKDSDTSAETSADASDGSLPLAGEHLIFGLNATFAPFEYVEGTDSDGNAIFAGLDIDLVKEFSERLGFTYEFSEMEFNGLIGAISSGRCDVIVSGISINDERDEVVDASEPYFMPRISILSYADNEFPDVESLEGHSCGVSLGTVYDQICTDNGNIDVREYDSTALAFQDLRNGGIDACMFDATQALQFIKDNPDMNLVRNILPDSYTEEYEVQGYVVLVPEGETELLGYFNDAIDAMKADGTLDALIVKWCGEDYLED